VGEPSLILADEPTGNLDSHTAQDIMDLLLTLNRERRVTLIIVTHDAQIAQRLTRQIRVHQGRVREACPA
jgi:putative ABC transport system ATP-binding protein